MYLIKATDDFMNVLMDLSLRHIHVLTNSFVSVKKIEDDNDFENDNFSFLDDLLEQIKNQERE